MTAESTQTEPRNPVKIIVFYDETPNDPIFTFTEEESVPLPETGEKVQLREAKGSEDPETYELDLEITEASHYIVEEKWTSYTRAEYSTEEGIAEQLTVYVMIEVEAVEEE